MKPTTCFAPAHILLPSEQVPLEQWGCIACDQFTSDRSYWQRAEETAAGAPSTLNLILPEVYLEDGDADARVEKIHATMQDYAQNVLTRAVDGFIYVERTEQSGRVRQGLVGKIDLEAQRLLDVTKAALYKGIEAAKAGNRIGDIGYAVQSYCEDAGFSVVRDFVGHGVGTKLHEDPSVPNFGHAGRGIRLLPGMTLAIEPMINLGTYKVKQLSDGWTVKTADGKLAAHFEHTIAITSNGPVILTKV